ncbi:MAG: HypC/HybG/HupF family hydrogenase formation chaperone, partial [Phycisphaerae bacterium]
MCLAIPGKLLDIDNNDGISRTGTVDFGGMRHRVSLAC